MTDNKKCGNINIALSRGCPLLTLQTPFVWLHAIICLIVLAGSNARQFICFGGASAISNELMINEEIRDREVRVIDGTGAQLGVMPIAKALMLADEAKLDLVKIVPNAQPPVCKMMDYDKHRFEQAKREKEIRKNQRVIAIKEVQLSATIEENDIQVKAKRAIKFLEDGDKVKVTIRFRGRQIAHQEIGLGVMNDFVERTKEVSVVERRPSTEGRHMIMVLAPKAEKAGKPERTAPKTGESDNVEKQ